MRLFILAICMTVILGCSSHAGTLFDSTYEIQPGERISSTKFNTINESIDDRLEAMEGEVFDPGIKLSGSADVTELLQWIGSDLVSSTGVYAASSMLGIGGAPILSLTVRGSSAMGMMILSTGSTPYIDFRGTTPFIRMGTGSADTLHYPSQVGFDFTDGGIKQIIYSGANIPVNPSNYTNSYWNISSAGTFSTTDGTFGSTLSKEALAISDLTDPVAPIGISITAATLEMSQTDVAGNSDSEAVLTKNGIDFNESPVALSGNVRHNSIDVDGVVLTNDAIAPSADPTLTATLSVDSLSFNDESVTATLDKNSLDFTGTGAVGYVTSVDTTVVQGKANGVYLSTTAGTIATFDNNSINLNKPTAVGESLDVTKVTSGPTGNDVMGTFTHFNALGGTGIVKLSDNVSAHSLELEINSGYAATGHRYGNVFDTNIINSKTGGVYGAINFVTDGSVRGSFTPAGNISVTSSGIFGTGVTTTTGDFIASAGHVDLSDSDPNIIGADSGATTRTTATNKTAKVASVHYTTTEEPVACLFAENTSTDNTLYIGAGDTDMNCATKIDMRVGATTTTTGVGTQALTITSNGVVYMYQGAIIEDNGLLLRDSELQLGNMAPPSVYASGGQIYANSGEVIVMDAVGNTTEISPHDPETNELWTNSGNAFTGKHTVFYPTRPLSDSNPVITWNAPKADWTEVYTAEAKKTFVQMILNAANFTAGVTAEERESIEAKYTTLVTEAYYEEEQIGVTVETTEVDGESIEKEVPVYKKVEKTRTVPVIDTVSRDNEINTLDRERKAAELSSVMADIETRWSGEEGAAYRAVHVPAEPSWIDSDLKKNPFSDRYVQP